MMAPVRPTRIVAAILGAAALAGASGAASAADLARGYVAAYPPPPPVVVDTWHVPACKDVAVTDSIAVGFQEREAEYWNTGLKIKALGDFRQIAYRPWGPGFIPRRFCSVRAYFNDGRVHTVYYSVINDAGYAGIGSGVEWCVAGLDRNLAYAPGCKMAQP